MFSFSGLQDQYIRCTTKTCLHFSNLFSIVPAVGISTRMRRKYRTDASCPPIHVSVSRSATRAQNRHWLSGRNIMLRCLEVCSRGIRARIRIEKARASTPPSLLGIDRKIAYANKKYHSGLM